MDRLPDELVEYTVRRWCMLDNTPREALRWMAHVRALCGRAQSERVMHLLCPFALRRCVAQREMHHHVLRRMLALDGIARIDEREGVGVAYRIWWPRGVSELLWCADEVLPRTIVVDKLRRQVALHVGEMPPLLVTVHKTVLRKRFQYSPFRHTDDFAIPYPFHGRQRIIRWVDREPLAVQAITPGEEGDHVCDKDDMHVYF